MTKISPKKQFDTFSNINNIYTHIEILNNLRERTLLNF